MTNLVLFQFKENEIRFVNGKPVANDVAAALGYADPAKTISTKVKPKNKGVAKMVTPGGTQSVTVLKEPGIYQLIFGSKLESAEQFQDWVFEEVLPAIRKTGQYSVSSMAPFWYQRLLLDGTKNKAPLGHFTIFREVIDLVRDLEANGYVLPDNAYPDISVGQCWASHLKNQGINPNHIHRPYQHHYPDGRIITANAYENLYLPEFRDWFNRMYLTNKLPKYLGNKDKSSLPALEKLLELNPGTINRLLKMSA